MLLQVLDFVEEPGGVDFPFVSACFGALGCLVVIGCRSVRLALIEPRFDCMGPVVKGRLRDSVELLRLFHLLCGLEIVSNNVLSIGRRPYHVEAVVGELSQLLVDFSVAGRESGFVWHIAEGIHLRPLVRALVIWVRHSVDGCAFKVCVWCDERWVVDEVESEGG